MRPSHDASFVVGFDLDMTLIDSRPGIKAAYDEVGVQSGVAIDTDVVVSRLGPPVENEMSHWVEPARVAELSDLYRRLYAERAVDLIGPMPGAAEALRAVHERGGRTIVITAKTAPHARLHLDHLGLDVGAVHGGAWRDGKSARLRAEDAWAYVGDHIDDIAAARTARARAVAVTTGPCSGLDLERAGADVILHSLLDFAGWLGDTRAD